jgi:hypothetical protein
MAPRWLGKRDTRKVVARPLAGRRQTSAAATARWLAMAAAVVGATCIVALAGPPAALMASEGGYSPSFDVTGAVVRPRRYTLADLQSLPPVTVASRCVVEGTSELADHSYKGVLLWTLVAEAQLAIPPADADPALRGYVFAVATDGFPAILPLVEIDPTYNHRDVIVAYERDGQPLDESLGMAQLVVPDDPSCARNVFWLAHLEVRYVAPLASASG